MANGEQLPGDIGEFVDVEALDTLRGMTDFTPDTVRTRILYSSYAFFVGLAGTIAQGSYDLFNYVQGDSNVAGYQGRLTSEETNWEAPGGDIPRWQNLVVLSQPMVEIRCPPTDTSVYLSTVAPSGGPTDGRVDPYATLHPADLTEFARACQIRINKGPNRVEQIALAKMLPAPAGVYGHTQAARQTPIAGSPGLSGSDAAVGDVNSRGYLPVTGLQCAPGTERRLRVYRAIPAGSKFSLTLYVARPITLLGRNTATPQLNDATGGFVVRVGFRVLESFKR